MSMQHAQRSTGIILKDERQRRYVLSILDAHYGRIQALVNRCTYATAPLQGAIVDYEVQQDDRGFKIVSLEPIALPHYQNYLQLLYTHQLLELVQHCVPLQAPTYEIYELVKDFIIHQHLITDDRIPKLVLGRLFYLTGMYEPFAPSIDDLVQHSLQDLMQQELGDALAAQLDAMVYACIARHPFAHTFKTVRLLRGMND